MKQIKRDNILFYGNIDNQTQSNKLKSYLGLVIPIILLNTLFIIALINY